MNPARIAALSLIAAAALAPVRAAEPEPLGDLALQVRLTAVPGSLSVVVLEAETIMGFELDGQVAWSIDGRLVAREALETIGGRALDVQPLPLKEAALVCAQVAGRLELTADLGRVVVESECLLWLPSEEPPASSGHRDVVLQERKRRPAGSTILQ